MKILREYIRELLKEQHRDDVKEFYAASGLSKEELLKIMRLAEQEPEMGAELYLSMVDAPRDPEGNALPWGDGKDDLHYALRDLDGQCNIGGWCLRTEDVNLEKFMDLIDAELG
jgi:hypothetical protein